MIKISISKDEEGICNGFCVKGHADYADSGQDIVCAAVSMLVLNTINAMEQFTSDEFDLQMDEKTGFIKLSMISTISSDSTLLLKSLMLGLEAIENQYGNDYIKIR